MSLLSNKEDCLPDSQRPKTFWEDFKKSHPLFFVHIPKTAGHSIYDLLNSNYPKETVLMPYSGVEGNLKEILALTAEGKSKIRVLAGHMPFGIHGFYGEGNYMTFLREPMDLAISSYYFNVDNPECPTYYTENALNRTLLQFAEHFDNIMTRYLIASAPDKVTFWLSGETNPLIKNNAFLGLECHAPVSIRTIALRQWSIPPSPTLYPSEVGVKEISVECSNDNFTEDIRSVAILQLDQDRDMHFHEIPKCEKGRFWRVRALAETQSARWGLIALKFFEEKKSLIPPKDFDGIAVKGFPFCSSAAQGFPAENAFDGRDRRAIWEVRVGSLTMRHCIEAMENLRDRCLVGLIERYDDSIRMIGHVLGWSEIQTKRLNANPNRHNVSCLSDREKQGLAHINRFDLILYRYAQQLFQSDLVYFRQSQNSSLP